MIRVWIAAFCPCGTPTEGSWSAQRLAMVQCPHCDRVLAATGSSDAMLAPDVEGLILDAELPTDQHKWKRWQKRLSELLTSRKEGA